MNYLYTTIINGQKYKFIYNSSKPDKMTIIVNGKKRIFDCSISFSSLEDFNKYHENFFKDKDCVNHFLRDISVTKGLKIK